MNRSAATFCGVACLLLGTGTPDAHAQKPPYDAFPPADPPYYRVRYEASSKPGELAFAVNYTIWIPASVKTLRGVVVHHKLRILRSSPPASFHSRRLAESFPK